MQLVPELYEYLNPMLFEAAVQNDNIQFTFFHVAK